VGDNFSVRSANILSDSEKTINKSNSSSLRKTSSSSSPFSLRSDQRRGEEGVVKLDEDGKEEEGEKREVEKKRCKGRNVVLKGKKEREEEEEEEEEEKDIFDDDEFLLSNNSKDNVNREKRRKKEKNLNIGDNTKMDEWKNDDKPTQHFLKAKKHHKHSNSCPLKGINIKTYNCGVDANNDYMEKNLVEIRGSLYEWSWMDDDDEMEQVNNNNDYDCSDGCDMNVNVFDLP
jgi:hypothetical protein